MRVGNREIARTLRTISELLKLHGGNPWKIRAYARAARAVEGLGESARALARAGRLTEVPGIGEGIAARVRELLDTGRVAYLDEIRGDLPEGVLEILRLPSVGPRKARELWRRLGVKSVEELREACLGNRLPGLGGFGPKSQERILEGIEFRARHRGEFLLGDALPLARALLRELGGCADVVRASVAGSVRRSCEIVRDIALVASSARPGRVLGHFVRLGRVSEVLARGEAAASVALASGLRVDLRVVPDGEFAPALVHETGSAEHRAALRERAERNGLRVTDSGVFRGARRLPCRDEAEFYSALGLPYIPPELRENAGELSGRAPPDLVTAADLRGVLHVHSDWSDGTAPIERMAEKARGMGLRYMGLSDHSGAAAYAGGLDEARLRKQMAVVDDLNRRWADFRILKGLECDILADGGLDLTPEVLGGLDFVIGSVHSHFSLPEREMTDRVCRALGNEHLDILGHPTGRLLLGRRGYRLDVDRVIEAARKHGKAIELNADPHRLDLDWTHCRRAKEKGVPISVNPDAHSARGLENLEYGVAIARKAWLGPGDVLNSRDWPALEAIFRRPPGRRARTG